MTIGQQQTACGLLESLPARARRGSKPRCHWLTHGPAADVAMRLTKLASPWAVVSAGDQWMPRGFAEPAEAQLHDAHRLIDPALAGTLGQWWLGGIRRERRTPNFDIASTCTIEGRRGLLLVEAKAHHVELSKESAGRSLGPKPSDSRIASHDSIGKAIDQAAQGLSKDTGLDCRLSRDRCYQLSNRLAWAWKLATLEVPVVLIYLGLLHADEMADRGQPLDSHADWEQAVRQHSAAVMDTRVWNTRWAISGGTALIPTIASTTVSLDGQFR